MKVPSPTMSPNRTRWQRGTGETGLLHLVPAAVVVGWEAVGSEAGVFAERQYSDEGRTHNSVVVEES